MSRQAVKFPAAIAAHLAQVLIVQARPRGHAEQDKVAGWVDFLRSGRNIKLEPPEAQRLISLLSAVCRPNGPAQATELGAYIKRLQGGR